DYYCCSRSSSSTYVF
nr:immunoglobulin light chain junction region [Macaca mulatta]MOV66840.1 immunoglobulin light chain junction region [Macaca mulatta]MOV67101.1 immunoglobulin light chain junction region [Macaca mulatta]MOV67295.1 immunoglobulin light chain junction region [Macaca mulatta]MOV67384.1 immunoglobulin light chain junction region [Macaca mulatta]